MDMHNCFHLLEQIQVTQKESHLFLGVHDTEDIVDCLETVQDHLIVDLATFRRCRLLQDGTQKVLELRFQLIGRRQVLQTDFTDKGP